MQRFPEEIRLTSDCMCYPPAGYGCAADDENKKLESTVRELSLNLRQSLALNDTPVVTARDLVLRKCGQIEPLPFEQCYPNT